MDLWRVYYKTFTLFPAHRLNQQGFIKFFYVFELLTSNPKAGLPLHQTSLYIRILWSRKVFVFQQKVYRNVEILQIMKEAATRLLT